MTLEQVKNAARRLWRDHRTLESLESFAEQMHRDGFKRGQDYERSRKPEPPIKISIRVTLPANLAEISISGSVSI